MALEKFKAPSLPVPPSEYTPQYLGQLIRVLGIYFSQLDSFTPNQAQSYRADDFYGGVFHGDVEAGTVTADSVTANEFIGGNFSGLNAVFADVLAATFRGNFLGGDAVFNNLSVSNANANIFTGAGYQINFPHIAAEDNTDQYADGDDDPTIVKWDTATETLGFTLNNDYTATPTHSGVYKIDFSLQFANTDNAAHDVYVWLKVDGTDVVGSSSKFTLPSRKSVGDYSFIVAYSSITFEVAAGKPIGLWWATDKAYSTTGPVDGVYMEHISAQTSPPYNRPANPSAVGSIVYVSAPKPPLSRIVPIGVQGNAKIGTVTVVTT